MNIVRRNHGIVPFIGAPMHCRPIQAIVPANPFEMMMNPFAGMQAIAEFGNGFEGFKVDVKETEEEYVVTADFPGADKSEVSIDIDDDLLTISYESNKEDGVEECGKWVVRERSYASTKRSFMLPESDGDNAEANMEDGVLSIKIPKKQEKDKDAKKIEIS